METGPRTERKPKEGEKGELEDLTESKELIEP